MKLHDREFKIKKNAGRVLLRRDQSPGNDVQTMSKQVPISRDQVNFRVINEFYIFSQLTGLTVVAYPAVGAGPPSQGKRKNCFKKEKSAVGRVWFQPADGRCTVQLRLVS